jgi:large subunit ribosomal protein L24
MTIQSVKARKQRRAERMMPQHQAGRLMHSTLSKTLRKLYHARALRVKTGDSVKVMRGSFAGKEGKVDRVDMKRRAIFIDKIEVTKKDGSKARSPVHPSNIMITDLSTDDKKRLKRRTKGESA